VTQLDAVGFGLVVNRLDLGGEVALLIFVLLFFCPELLNFNVFRVHLQLHLNHKVLVLINHMLRLCHLPVQLINARKCNFNLVHTVVKSLQLFYIILLFLSKRWDQVIRHQGLLISRLCLNPVFGTCARPILFY
jgi:hypothetical protein